MITVCVGMGLFMESLKNNDAPVGYVDHAGVFSNPIPPPIDGSREPLEFISFSTEDEAKQALESKNIQAYYVIAEDYSKARHVKLFLHETTRKERVAAVLGFPPNQLNEGISLPRSPIVRR